MDSIMKSETALLNTDNEIKKLRLTLGSLIGFLYKELGVVATNELYKMLTEDIPETPDDKLI